ncbi:DUF5691 domain-containing protein [Adonisia turfae]|uniref:Uncharacterized protein n=1 Tax=Adonisia turfae CCMR0081 TaxID=2292702 RepID=A0A6M0RWD4_9CYAN|nr:DUF5691 domain-containing protein [Adonisia turfae]NEZ60081.1 hypothetical protein [Adonisia turfae CCMR0081]
MEYWKTLLNTALIGTDRQSPNPPKTLGTLTTALGQLNWQQPERSILSAAGAIALYQQVGQLPITVDWALLDPCADEDLPCCSAQTARHLNTILAEHPAIMPELLRLLTQSQQRVPEQLLPKLLHFGRQRSELRPQITAVIGKRGQWLASQNSAWEYGSAQRMTEFHADSAAWREGSRSERALFLQQWRETDADAAREALEAVWSSELAKDRAALISSLACNLSIADEPFLEKARCDRAQAVRQQTVGLLVKLPESHLCQRMAERVSQFISLQASTSELTIKVTLPKTFEPVWEEDGITSKTVAGLGEKASWLYQMLTSVSLHHWHGKPAAIAYAIKEHQWQDMLLKGWGVAALRQQNTTWANALVKEFDLQQIDERLLSDLLTLLTIEQQETALREKIPSQKDDIIHWLHQVSRCSQTWSLEFSQLVLEKILTLANNSDRNNYGLHYLLKEIAIVLHPDLTPAIAEPLTQMPENDSRFYWIKSALDEFHEHMHFRYEMHQAFKPSG